MKHPRRLIWLTGTTLVVLMIVVSVRTFRRSQADNAITRVIPGMTFDEAKSAVECDGRYFHVVNDYQGYFFEFDDKSVLIMMVDRRGNAIHFKTNTISASEWVKWVLNTIGL